MEELIDEEFLDFYRRGQETYEDGPDYGAEDYERGGDDYGAYDGGYEDGGDDDDRKATFKEQEATRHGELGVGLGAREGQKGKRQIGKTAEDIASDGINMVLSETQYNQYNSDFKKTVHKKLMAYKNINVANVQVLVVAGVWVVKQKSEPKDMKVFQEFCKKHNEDLNPIDVFRYIRSLLDL